MEPSIEGFDFYFDAFRELSSCRPGGIDLQAIPFTAILEYSRIYEVGDFEEFKDIIRTMDRELMKLNSEKAIQTKTEAKPNGKPNANTTHKN